jgi:hypothetical protein
MTAIQDLRVHAPVAIAEAVCLIVFCSLMVGLRFYARHIKRSRLGLDDFAIAIALVSLSILHYVRLGMADILSSSLSLAWPLRSSSVRSLPVDASHKNI